MGVNGLLCQFAIKIIDSSNGCIYSRAPVVKMIPKDTPSPAIIVIWYACICNSLKIFLYF